MDSTFGTFKIRLEKMARTESQRDITSSSSNVQTQSTSITDNGIYRFFRRKKKDVPPVVEVSQPAEIELDASLLKPGVTGVDFSLPLFDGQSTNPADHIIDLDTDSMERHADVRVYFYNVGQNVESIRQWRLGLPNIVRPTDYALCVDHDERMVKLGREYLKEAKRNKQGWFISRERDHLDQYLAGNHPGQPWYRLPTVGLVARLNKGVEEEEGSVSDDLFKDSFFDVDSHNMRISCIIKTNIRVPMIWIETLKEEIVQGTHGWDIPIYRAYDSELHPAHRVLQHDPDITNLSIVANLMLYPTTLPHGEPCDSVLTCQVLARDFAHFEEPVEESMDPQKQADLRAELMAMMSSPEDFFYGKPEFRKRKTFLGIPLP